MKLTVTELAIPVVKLAELSFLQVTFASEFRGYLQAPHWNKTRARSIFYFTRVCNFLSLPSDTLNDFIINLSHQAGNNLNDFFWLCFVYVICYLPVHIFNFFWIMGGSEIINSLHKPRRLLIFMILLLFCMNVHINISVKILKCKEKRKK